MVALLLHAVPAYATPTMHEVVGTGVSRPVTLITGERVLVGSSQGRPTIQVIRARTSGLASQLTTVTMNGDQYVIPAVARPYLGRYLDPSLFDVTQLARGGAGRTVLHLTYRPGTVPRLPGVTITSAHAGVATGFVSPSSARAFGRALAAQAIADSRAGWPTRSRLFGSITSVTPDLTAPPVVTPHFPMVTLIIKVTARSGAPLPFGFGFLMNADNGGAYSGFILVIHGEARVSVPLGTYEGVFDQGVFRRDGTAKFFVMPVTNYQVSGPLQTLSIDARTATNAPSVTAPLPASMTYLSLSIDATDEQHRSSWGWGYDVGPGVEMRLGSASPTTLGTFTESTRWVMADPGTSGTRYSFDASFRVDAVPSDQSNTIPAVEDSLAIRSTYASDRGGALGARGRLIFQPDSFFASTFFLPLHLPAHRTDYISAPVGSMMLDLVAANFRAPWDPGVFVGSLVDVAPGSRGEVWLRQPVSLAVPVPGPQDRFGVCAACRSETGMTFASLPADADGHQEEVWGNPDGTPIVHFAVYRNGTLIRRRADAFGAVFPVPRGPSTYRVETSFDRQGTGARLSTDISSVVTFRSSAEAGTPVPPHRYCFTGRHCRTLPVLQASVDLHANWRGSVSRHPTVFDVVAGHIEGAEDPAISWVRVQVRLAGSASWISLPVTAESAGTYGARFLASGYMRGRTVDLRITVADDAGGRLRQTTSSAFRVSA